MRVIALPQSLRRAIAMLALGIPLATFEAALVSRASWWKLPYETMGIWAATSAAIVIILAAGLARAKAWAWDLTAAIAIGWCATTGWLSAKMGMPGLGFLAVFLSFYFGWLLVRLRSELGRSYFDPGVRWFQGGPEPISFLKCAIAREPGAPELEFRVSRLDREGAFVFGLPGEKMEFIGKGEAQELIFSFRERSLRCRAVPMRYFRRSSAGAGFRFKDLSLDTQKQLGDFIENLRGEGYVE